MKKMFSILLVCIALILLSVPTYASIGSIIGFAKYTDISAYINNYPIPSYNIYGNTAVVAEDLRYYGFDVVWNNATRSLSVARSGATSISGKGKVYKNALLAGADSDSILETDIVTYVNGVKVPSYNIDGKTCITMNSLACFGSLEWNEELRAIKLWLSDLPVTDYVALEDKFASVLPKNIKFYYGTDIPTIDSVMSNVKFREYSEAYSVKESGDYWYDCFEGWFDTINYATILDQLGWVRKSIEFKDRTRIDKNGIIKKENDYIVEYFIREGQRKELRIMWFSPKPSGGSSAVISWEPY